MGGCNCGGKCGVPSNETLKCPVCGRDGVMVTLPLVENLLKNDKKKDIVMDDKYFLCMDPACRVSYFNRKGKPVFKVEDLKVPIWYKKGAEKQIACYCNNITFDQVREQAKAGKKIWKEIVGAYRKKPVCNCALLNPMGNCCTSVFYGIVNEELKKMGKEIVSQEFIDKFGCC